MGKNKKKSKQVFIASEKKVPKVSVIVPIYNVEKYLVECIDSIVNQNLKEIEVICVNDGSTDSSLDIINEYAAKDDRIIVISGKNRGYGHAVNEGIRSAQGEYIGIVESDDYILPDMYERLYGVAEVNPGIDIVKSDTVRFYRNGDSEERKYVSVCKEGMYDRIIKIKDEPECYSAYMINTTGIYRRNLFTKYQILLNESPGAAFQDNGLWFQLMTRGESIFYLRDAFYMYRMDRPDSSTNSTTYENALCIFSEWKFIYDTLKNKYGIREQNDIYPVYVLRFFGSCYYHFTRIQEEYKLLFLKHLSCALNELKQNGCLRTELLPGYQCNDMIRILDSPNAFYYGWCNKNVSRILSEEAKEKSEYLQQTINNISMLNTNKDIDEIQISVIVPMYNVEKTIAKCLQSVIEQSIKKVEIICIDDGSTDKTLSVALTYALSDARIRVMAQNNMGSGPARNRGLQAARGEFVAFLDADDFLPEKDSLEFLYRKAIDNNVYICGGNILIAHDGNMKRDKVISFEKEGLIQYEDWQKTYGYYAFIYKRSFLNENEIMFPSYLRFQDPPFLLKAMIKAKYFYAVKKDVYQHNFQPGHVVWNVKKICDLIDGVTDCLRISNDYSLAEAHYDSLIKLERDFADRIAKFSYNYDVIRKLVTAENAVNLNLIKTKVKSDSDKYKLKILVRVLDELKRDKRRGYIGPNAFSQYICLKDECAALKNRILETEMSISYRIGVILSGGKSKARIKGEWIDSSELNKYGDGRDLVKLQNDRCELDNILIRLYSSECMKKGLKATMLLRGKQNV